MIAVSEGIADKDGTAIAAKFTKEVDSHGNVQLSGSGALGDQLAKLIKEQAGISRVRADTFGYLQRSFAGLVSEVDAKEARTVGQKAVQAAVAGKFSSGSIAIRRKPGRKYNVYYERVELRQVSKETRHMPDNFINKAGNDVTNAFIEYARPLVGKLPRIGRFKGYKVTRAT